MCCSQWSVKFQMKLLLTHDRDCLTLNTLPHDYWTLVRNIHFLYFSGAVDGTGVYTAIAVHLTLVRQEAQARRARAKRAVKISTATPILAWFDVLRSIELAVLTQRQCYLHKKLFRISGPASSGAAGPAATALKCMTAWRVIYTGSFDAILYFWNWRHIGWIIPGANEWSSMVELTGLASNCFTGHCISFLSNLRVSVLMLAQLADFVLILGQVSSMNFI